ncbi:MAG: DUF4198 domain-containing protein, partial [Pseudomonadota bacterium]
MIRTFLIASSLACIFSAAKAHEFWIDPVEHMVAPGDPVVADIRVGEEYEGTAFAYIPQRFRRFDVAHNGRVLAMPGTVGDRPAMRLKSAPEGLLVVIHATTDQHITW